MQLLQGDCLELMKDIPDGSVDMVLCDLPYGTTDNKWDSTIPLELLWGGYKRIIKDNGVIILFGQPPFSAELIVANKQMFRYEWIWRKRQGVGFLNAKKMPLRAHESILCFYKKLPTYNPQMRIGFKPYSCKNGRPTTTYGGQRTIVTVSNGERFPIDVLEYAYDKEKFHPTQKPVALLEYLIKTYTNPGDTVLDNCMGSGSTGVACVNTGRDFIGIELDPGYFEIAKRRIEEADAQMRLEELAF